MKKKTKLCLMVEKIVYFHQQKFNHHFFIYAEEKNTERETQRERGKCCTHVLVLIIKKKFGDVVGDSEK